MSSEPERPEPPVLDAAEARALGCLIEKEATTPDAYPLTVNATLVAANQKTARDPVLALEPGEVHGALRRLESQRLVRQQFSSRAERYEHCLASALNLTRQQVALLGLLLLRGPQTLGELFARSERLARFADVEDLRHQLERLLQRDLAVQLPRSSGQREDRYVHQMSGPVDVQALMARMPAADTAAVATAGNAELVQRLQQLEQAVADLRRRLDALVPGEDDAG